MQNGWIKLHRKMLWNPVAKRPTWAWLWIVILLKANHEENRMMWNDGIIVVKEGQLITSRDKLAEASGLSATTVERVLKFLESEHQIGQQSFSKFRLITILNWKEYQEERTPKRTPDDTTRDTTRDTQTRRIKKDKKNTGGASPPEESSLIPEVIKLFEEVNPACKKFYGNTTQRTACHDLIETYGFEEVSKVIAFLPRSNKVPYMPTITTPAQLWSNYQKLKDKWEQKKEESTNKSKANYVL